MAFFEIITKRPVSKHFKHGVVVCIKTYILRSLCFPDTKAFFVSAIRLFFGVPFPKKTFELSHSELLNIKVDHPSGQ
jgi:hypothetical protein